jgi:hypothetical protein
MKSITLIYSEGLFVSHHVSFSAMFDAEVNHVRSSLVECVWIFFLTIKELFAVVVVADEMGVRGNFFRGYFFP